MREVKNLPANAGDIRDVSSVPGLGRSLGGGHGNPLQYSYLKNPRTEEPGGLPSLESHRVGLNWSDLAQEILLRPGIKAPYFSTPTTWPHSLLGKTALIIVKENINHTCGERSLHFFFFNKLVLWARWILMDWFINLKVEPGWE